MTIIAVDDGHGIETPGKRSPDGYKENEFNHFTKEYLKEELINNKFKVVDCSPNRDDNSLSNRVEIANNAKADIFISIHFNAMGNSWQSEAEGIETYYHNKSSNGRKLANLVHKNLLQETKQNNRGVKSDSVLYKNGLYVLRNTLMPAILIECGFMDNKYDLQLMKYNQFRKECAIEICKGVCEYFGVTYNHVSNISEYEEVLKNSELDDYEAWIHSIHEIIKFAKITDNLKLQRFKYLGDLIVKIRNNQ